MIDIQLSPKGFVKNGCFDQKEALYEAGVRAAVCVAKSNDDKLVTTADIRKNNSRANLIRRGISTILQAHTTPSEQEVVSLEITGISRRLCLILNNEKEYAADELSLRYTKAKESEYNTRMEIELYHKWLEIFEKVITKDYWDYFRKTAKSDNEATRMIREKAQENARNFLGLATRTSITYTVPFAQINKIAYMMERVINNPLDDFEKSCVPEMQEFIKALKDKKVLLTKNDVYEMITSDDTLEAEVKLRGKNILYLTYQGDDSLLFANTKSVDLSLFAKRNKFSAIDFPNEVTTSNISYNNYQSLSCLAQNQRHRTIDLEMKVPEEEITFTVPLFLNDYPELIKEYLGDINKIKETYPLGMNVKVNMNATLANLFNYVSKERCCMRAQSEIARMYTLEVIPYIYNELLTKADLATNPSIKAAYQKQAKVVETYLNKYRCMFNDYKCSSPCHVIRLERKL